ncbi:hypothetical protein AB6A40_011523 [Gnathostoma spinigerum]|uniref:Uncharacterized protein n=1 Tax=Gnathostoma spinigerum TaxID=75299 RepID=A0ABD6F3I7_9BILA
MIEATTQFQAALVPSLVALCKGTHYENVSTLILTTTVFAIFITAPIGQLILTLIGPMTLSSTSTNKVTQIEVHDSVAGPSADVAFTEDESRF